MSIWGKIVGGAAGFALGGPLGALIGVAAGHAIDRMSETQGEPFDPRIEGQTEQAAEHGDRGWGGGRHGFSTATKQIAFTTAVIALGAKLAKADGIVTRDEVDAFKQVFQIPPGESRAVARIFNQAKKNAHGFEPYARQVARIFRDNPAVLEELLNALFHIAKADGQYHPGERDYLHKVAEILGFDERTFKRIEAEHTVGREADAYAVLGLGRDASDDQVKKAYRKLIRENHPDRLVAQGMPPEFVDQANDKMATINAAYDKIEKERGIK